MFVFPPVLRREFQLKSPFTKSFLLLIFLISIVYSSFLQAETERFDLLLAGGGLKTCSSMVPKNCTGKPDKNQGKAQILYKVDEQGIARWKNSFPAKEKENDSYVNIISENVNIYSSGVMERGALRAHFKSRGLLDWYRDLPDPLYYALLDALEVPQLTAEGARLEETVFLKQTRNPSSVNIYETFFAQAAMRTKPGATPKIAVITASSRDPFEVADFYRGVFSQTGADTVWLPLDKTFQQARALEEMGLGGCDMLAALRARNSSFYRERIYPLRTALQEDMCRHPEKLIDQLNAVQGVFFNGGDQSLTLAALNRPDGMPSEALRLIHRRVKEGQLIVGGTSAGTAVQAGRSNTLMGQSYPVPMITNGDSANAMARGALATFPPSQRCEKGMLCDDGLDADDLTYRGNGGSGLFSLGLLDTHFSERDRETRLAVFAQATHQRLAFGVDEATALLVSEVGPHYSLSVVGQGGVFIVDRLVSRFEHSVGMTTAQSSLRSISAMSHFLSAGDRAVFDTAKGSWQFNLAGSPSNEARKLGPLKTGVWRDNVRAVCGSRGVISWQQFGNVYALQGSEHTQFAYNSETDHCSYVHLPFVVQKTSR